MLCSNWTILTLQTSCPADGPMRRFRGSIYVDGMIPETDDVEYDRKTRNQSIRKLR